MIKEVENKDKESKLVFDPKIARKLCKLGFVIIDIKPNRENTDKSIFVFENTEKFQQAFATLIEEMKKKKEVEVEVEVEVDIDLDIEYCD